jgi:hypothetical protein
MTQPDMQDPTVVDTSAPEEQAVPDTTVGHTEEVTSSEDVSPSADETTQKTELAQKREEGKLKQVQEEAKKLREEAEAFKKQANDLAEVLAEDKLTYRKALQRTGYTPEQADQVIADLQAQNPNLWQVQDNPEIMNAVSQHPVVRQAEQFLTKQKQEEIERDNVRVLKFEADKPDMTANPIYDLETARQIVGTQARFLGLRPENQGKSEEELWQIGYEASRAILNPEGIQRTIEDAELNGMLKANADNATSLGVTSSQIPDKKSSAQLSDVELRAMKASGNFKSVDEYLEWKSK